MKAIVTVVGRDRIGIIAGVCGLLSQLNINILDITQTILQGTFTMTMLVDTAACTRSFDAIAESLTAYGTKESLSIRIQREDIFTAMHHV